MTRRWRDLDYFYEVCTGPDEYVEHTARLRCHVSPYDPGRIHGPLDQCYPPEGGEVDIDDRDGIEIRHGEGGESERITWKELVRRVARDRGCSEGMAERDIEDELREQWEAEEVGDYEWAEEMRGDMVREEGW